MSANILIAEDDEFLLHAYQSQLESDGYKVTLAKDGQEAIDRLSSFTPDLIILDLVMPKKGGMEVLRLLRSNERTMHIPVIIATNVSNRQDQLECESLPGVKYTIKTDVSLEQFSAIVKEALQG